TTLLWSSSALVYGDGVAAGLPNGAPALNGKHTKYFTGRSDNFDPVKLSTNPQNARLDPEGIRVSNDGRRVYISDEYGPYIYEFDRESGQRTRAFTIPDNLAVAVQSAQGDVEINGNTSGRVANKGMEGLAITPDGKTLVGIMQAPLIQDGGKVVRILSVDIQSGKSPQYAYALTTGTGVSEIVAVNNHEFLVDERDGKGQGDGSAAAAKQIFKIDLSGAADVGQISGSANLAPLAVPKTLFLDVVSALTAAGISAIHIPAKLEGMAFSPDVVRNGVGSHTLYIANDNDFLAAVPDKNNVVVDNPNQYFVFAFGDGDLSFVPQKFKLDDGGDHRD